MKGVYRPSKDKLSYLTVSFLFFLFFARTHECRCSFGWLRVGHVVLFSLFSFVVVCFSPQCGRYGSGEVVNRWLLWWECQGWSGGYYPRTIMYMVRWCICYISFYFNCVRSNNICKSFHTAERFLYAISDPFYYLNYQFDCSPFHVRRASDYGLMKIDNKGRVISFSEKPKGNDLKAQVFYHDLSHSHVLVTKDAEMSLEFCIMYYFNHRQWILLFWGCHRKRQKRSHTLLQWKYICSRKRY